MICLSLISKEKQHPLEHGVAKKCNKTGHNAATCGRAPPPPKRPRGMPFGTGRGRGRGRVQRECRSRESAAESEDETGNDSSEQQDDLTPSTSED
jgi:hypothetical protein